MLYGIYGTTGCWAMIRHGSAIDLSGGHERDDQEQGILLAVRDVDGQPASDVFRTSIRDGSTHISAGTGDHICFSTARHPSAAGVFDLDENRYGSGREAVAVCARPPAEPWPSHAP
jgi:hypothetical protein